LKVWGQVLVVMAACGGEPGGFLIAEGCPDRRTMKISVDGECVCLDPADVLSPDGQECGNPGKYGTGLSAPAAQVAAGVEHTCARTADGELLCWGNNWSDQLGIPDAPVDVLRATAVVIDEPIVAVAAGESHTCMVAASGDVYCWGSDGQGQLGDGDPGKHSSRPDTPVWMLPAAQDVCSGDDFSCALTRDREVFCWGDNSEEQLGTTGAPDVPVQLPVGGIAGITCGGQHACAWSEAGEIGCWGRNDRGQVGGGSFGGSAPLTMVAGLPAATVVSAGDGHTCALTVEGEVWCWGSDSDGQLGDGGENAHRASPVRVYGLAAAATQVASGGAHTCAVLQDGVVSCWGQGLSGQLGTGRTDPSWWAGDTVAGLTVERVSCGGAHTCGLTEAGQVYCWGANGNGQLGDGTGMDSPVPVLVADAPGLEPEE
jgi:hypothetical protein